jgi:hypothetical protein
MVAANLHKKIESYADKRKKHGLIHKKPAIEMAGYRY